MALLLLCLPFHAALARTYTHSWILTVMHTPIYIHNCENTHTHTHTHISRHAQKSTSLIRSSVFASDGSLINVATLELFIISVTSNLQSDMIGLMYDALVRCGWLLHSKAKGKNILLLVNRNLFPCQLHFLFSSFVHLKELCFLTRADRLL